ncbi:beta-ketoacyl synthase N-terminal-like domain-containing protein [Micromonospora sp. FIMYZ51]|uniref:type I polyketide synthase n=1 Tax=Micromonospora sp. FIMYZ51 TaxID=3051832 RepID=UPI00311E8CA9
MPGELEQPLGAGARTTDEIAIVGISCRLPGAAGPREFTELLRTGTDAIREIPADRLSDLGVGASPSLSGGFIDGVDQFDPAFFGISPREAAEMDPQQRLALELGWEAFEDARIVPGGRAGVFVGAMADDYAALAHARGALGITPHTVTGLHRGMIANRISYALRLRGPSLTVDCGQSSSLVAVHLAAESMRRGECRLALAGGVNLNLSPDTFLALTKFGALSPEGRCYTFDARADGYVRGEGGAIVLLKFLADAIADGSRIYCVLKGSAVNNDGGGPGLTAPDRDAQAEVLRLAYRNAGIDPARVGYVELHGTGTVIGDRTEAAALGQVLGAARSADDPLAVGSVKTNIGHLEGAAGIAGLVKAALCVRNRELVPSLNFEAPSPGVPLAELNLRMQREYRRIEADGRPFVAGVSSFGMGGTNCHVVLAEAPEIPTTSHDAVELPVVPWVVSGHSVGGLRGQAGRLVGFVGSGLGGVSVGDVGLSLVSSRAGLSHRAVVVGDSVEALRAGLVGVAGGVGGVGVVEGVVGGVGRTAFVFPGQGGQWVGMGRELWESCGVFGEWMGCVSGRWRRLWGGRCGRWCFRG